MLMAMVSFDENSPKWLNDARCNEYYLSHIEDCINGTIRHKGYIYLNQIYDILGVEWNPDDVNRCVKCDSIDRLKFVEFEVFKMEDNSYAVRIMCYD